MTGASVVRARTAQRIAVVGRLGVYPMVRLNVPGRRLVAFLAVHCGSAARSVVSAHLWPDQPEQHGRANLRRALWQLPSGWVTSVGGELVLNAAVDLDDARAAAGMAISGAALTLEQIEMLSNDLLPGWHEEWLVGHQEAFRLLRVQALERACRVLALAGEHVLATQAGAAALTAEPLRESAAAALIDAHLAEGNRFEAARRYRAFARLLNDELGVTPDPGLTARLGGLVRSA